MITDILSREECAPLKNAKMGDVIEITLPFFDTSRGANGRYKTQRMSLYLNHKLVGTCYPRQIEKYLRKNVVVKPYRELDDFEVAYKDFVDAVKQSKENNE